MRMLSATMKRALLLVVLFAACSGKSEPREAPPAPAPMPVADAAKTEAAVPVAADPKPGAAPGFASIAKIIKGKARATSIAIDSKGDIVLAVHFDGPAAFGDTDLDGGEGSTALVKVHANKIAWTKPLGKGATIEHAAVAIDSHDDILIAATMRDTVDLGGGALASAGDKDILVAKLAADGNHLWSHRFGGPAPDHPASVAVDPKDHVIVAGYYAGTVDFGGRKLPAKSDAEMFVARYTPQGTLVYANRLGGEPNCEIYDVTVDSNGNAIAIGAFMEKLDLATTKLTGDGKPQTFVVAYAPSGRIAWSRAYSTGLMLLNTVASDTAGGVVLAGTEINAPDEVSTGQPSQRSITSMIVALGPDHKTSWSLAVGSAGMTNSVSIAIAEHDDVIAVGDSHSAPFGDKSVTDAHAFAARISSAGKLAWVRGIPHAAQITPNPIVAARGATVVVAAQVEDSAPSLVLLQPE